MTAKTEKMERVRQMNEKMNVLDVQLDNCTAKDAMKIIAEYMQTEELNTVDIVTVDTLMRATQLDGMKEERMGQMLSGGTTLLYVSHDINSVRQLCDHAIWIDKGNVRMSGLVEEVTTEYMHMNQ